MGIRVTCPNCNKQLNVKSFLAGKRGVCPECRTKFDIPARDQHNVVLEVEDPDLPAVAIHTDGPMAAAPAYAPGVPQINPNPRIDPAAPYLATAPANGYSIPGVVPAGGMAMARVPETLPIAPPAAVASPDPIAQAPHASWHICTAAGEKYGPVMGPALRQWIAERRLAADSLVWRDGWDQWQRADVVFAEVAAVPPVAIMAAPVVPGAVAMPGMFPVAEQPDPMSVFPSEPTRPAIARSYGRRPKNNNLRAVVLVLLVLAVLILAPLLGYVLMRQF